MEKTFLQLNKAFTLAEVLITLVIIGVIAALTIPTAINNTKEQELKSQFAKAYSTISQAIYKTEMNDFYGYAMCFYKDTGGQVTSDCGSFYSRLAKNLQIQKICEGNSKSNGCIPTYKSYNTNAGCNGFDQDHVENINYSYVLANGQIINVYGGHGHGLFLVDINGHKGPNAYGKDLFAFTITRNDDTGIYISGNYCDYPVNGGHSTKDMILYALAGKK